MSHPNFILDKRVVARNIAKGILTQDDLDQSIANLKDVADNAMASRADQPEPEVDEATADEASADEAEGATDEPTAAPVE